MPWPLVSHFSAMLQNPQVAFRDAELKSCTIERDTLGQPRPWSGNFATVYRGTYADGGGAVAIRVFNREASDRRQRYEEISKYLADRKLQSLIGFQYVDRGIRSASDGKFYPMVTMQWVPGDTLFNWLGEECGRGNIAAITQVADRWVDLVAELRSHNIAHGDLQHGNVMVTDSGELKLVDYDCMCVPSLVGRSNLEIGVEPYQHPTRKADTLLSLELDNFSAIMIQLALRALSVDPTLWQRYVTQPGYDKMLMRRSDFETPQSSALYREFSTSPNEEVRTLTATLWNAYRQPPEHVPRLETLVNSYDKVGQLLAARDWDAAVTILEQRPPAGQAPPNLQPAINEAFERVYCRKALDQAVAAGNEAEMIRLYNPQLLDDYPAAQPSVDVARSAADVMRILKQLKHLHKRQEWAQFVSMWDENRPLLEGRQSAEAYERNADAWRQRIYHFNEVQNALAADDVDVRQLAQAWKALVEAGGHPDAKPLQDRVNNLLRREKSLMAVRRVPAELSEMNDRMLIEAWDEDRLAGWDKGEQLRPLYDAAQKRLSALEQVRRIASTLEDHFDESAERELAEAASHLPSGYDHEWSERASKAHARIEALDVLLLAAKDSGSDRATARAWQKLVSLNGRELVPAQMHKGIDKAVCRFPVLLELEDIPLDLPPDELDRQLLAIWDHELLEDSRDADPWREAYRDALARKPLIDQLNAAIQHERGREIDRLVQEPQLQDYRFPNSWQAKINEAQSQIQTVDDLLEGLRNDDRSKFHEVFDAELFRSHADRLGEFHGALDDWMTTEILPAEKLGLQPGEEPALKREARKKYRLHWQWPDERFTRQCVVAICPAEIKPNTPPDRAKAVTTLTIPHETWELAEGGLPLHAEGGWSGGYVYVWAVIDLDFQLFYSEAVELGRMPKLWM